jgi:cysteine desulfurase
MSLYLDANAAEPLRPEARAAVLAALDLPGNPSSVHGAGRAARRVLERARDQVAARFGPAEVVFTAGGTEANALAIHALGAGRRVLVGGDGTPGQCWPPPAARRRCRCWRTARWTSARCRPRWRQARARRPWSA